MDVAYCQRDTIVTVDVLSRNPPSRRATDNSRGFQSTGMVGCESTGMVWCEPTGTVYPHVRIYPTAPAVYIAVSPVGAGWILFHQFLHCGNNSCILNQCDGKQFLPKILDRGPYMVKKYVVYQHKPVVYLV